MYLDALSDCFINEVFKFSDVALIFLYLKFISLKLSALKFQFYHTGSNYLFFGICERLSR